MAQYSAATIKRVQEIIDSSDPFLIEILREKSYDQLMEQYRRMEREMELIDKANEVWRDSHHKRMQSVHALIMMHEINRGDGHGGVVIA